MQREKEKGGGELKREKRKKKTPNRMPIKHLDAIFQFGLEQNENICRFF